MILSDKRILEEMEKGTIKIVPYLRDCLGSTSYDVHLGKNLAMLKNTIPSRILKFQMRAIYYCPTNFIWV